MHTLAAPFPVYFAKVKSSNRNKIVLLLKGTFLGGTSPSFFPYIMEFLF